MLCNKRPHNERVIGLSQLPWQQTATETEVTRLSGAAPQNAFCADGNVKEPVCVLPSLLFLAHHFNTEN